MKTILWLCATLALVGTLDQAAGIRNLLDTAPAQQLSPGSASLPLSALEQITNPKPSILTYPNAPGYPPDLAPDPAFMDLPNYAPGPGTFTFSLNHFRLSILYIRCPAADIPCAAHQPALSWSYLQYVTHAKGPGICKSSLAQ